MGSNLFGAAVKDRWPHIEVGVLGADQSPSVVVERSDGKVPLFTPLFCLEAADALHAVKRLEAGIAVLDRLMENAELPRYILQYQQPREFDEKLNAPFVVFLTVVAVSEEVGVATLHGLNSATLLDWSEYKAEFDSNAMVERAKELDRKQPIFDKTWERRVDTKGRQFDMEFAEANPLTVDFAKLLSKEFPNAILKFIKPKGIPQINKVTKTYFPPLFELRGSTFDKLCEHVLEQFTLLWKQVPMADQAAMEYEFHCQFSEVFRIEVEGGDTLSVMTAIAVVPKFPPQVGDESDEADINMEVVEALQAEERANKRHVYTIELNGMDWIPEDRDIKALQDAFRAVVMEKSNGEAIPHIRCEQQEFSAV